MDHSPDSSQPLSDDDGLFARAKAGDQEAWRELVDRCFPKIQRVVRRRLNRPMRSLFDSTDFANSVFSSLAAKCDRFEFQTVEALLGYLAQAAQQKVNDEYRRQLSQKRDLDRTRYIDDPDEGGYEFIAPEPTASKWAMAKETREQLVEGQADAVREIVDLKGEGYSTGEVAERTGLTARTVQRYLQNLGARLKKVGGGRP